MKKHRWVILTFIVVLIIIFLANITSYLLYLPNLILLEVLRAPLYLAAGTLNNVKDILEYPSLRKNNAELKEKIGLLTEEVLELRECAVENRRLRELLNLSRSIKYETVPASIIGKDISNWRASVLINKGKNQGVRVNTVVLGGKGLAGRVTEVYNNVSRVMLITDPNSKVAVIIQSTRESGILAGLRGNVCTVKYLPHDTSAEPGDYIITSGGSMYPKGLLAGTVIGIEKSPDKLYASALIESISDFSKLEEVLCVVGEKEKASNAEIIDE